MASIFDVAAYVLAKQGGMTTWKLQKLVYYSQAWATVWDEQPLFSEEIQAWANGPVVRELYERHRGEFRINNIQDSNPDRLTPDQKETIDRVLEFYGNKSPQWLSDLTHMEDPWKNARKGIPDGARSDKVISLADMAEYYGGL